MRSLRSISTTRESSVRLNLRNSTAGSSASRWHTDFQVQRPGGPLRQDEDGVGFGFTNLRQLPVRVPPTPASPTGTGSSRSHPLRSEAPDNASTSGRYRSRYWRGVTAASHTRVHGGVERFGKH